MNTHRKRPEDKNQIINDLFMVGKIWKARHLIFFNHLLMWKILNSPLAFEIFTYGKMVTTIALAITAIPAQNDLFFLW